MTHSITLLLSSIQFPVGLWVLFVTGAVCLLIGSVYAIKSNERIKREEQITRREAIQRVSEGTLTVEDADKLVNPKKRWFQ